MSQKVAICYAGKSFWAYDVILNVLIKHLLDAASSYRNLAWLNTVLEEWKINTVVSDYAFNLHEQWNSDQVAIISKIIASACDKLKIIEEISASEIATWRILPDEVIFTRGMDSVPTKPIIKLGQAIDQLLHHRLPEAPPGTWWFFTHADVPQTIAMGTKTP